MENNESAALTAFALFLIASITDYLDGILARKYGESQFGIVFDPIADKILVVSILILLVKHDIASILASSVIILREIIISGIREKLATSNIIVRVSKLAKVKTSFQMISIMILIISYGIPENIYINEFGNIFLSIAAIIALYTAIIYIKDNSREIFKL